MATLSSWVLRKAILRIADNVTIGFYADGTSGLKNSLQHGSSDLFVTADGSSAVVLDAAGLQTLPTTGPKPNGLPGTESL